ncbi:MAG TPA: response regulator transcription factor [Burkholderiales bacterium]|jgi:DNA-binding NarL/FixJ family response regulator
MAGTALVVEDHPLYRDALTHVLRPIFGADGVRAASTAEEGLRVAASEPELGLVLLDPGLPGLQGCEAIAAFRRVLPKVSVIAISASDDRREAAAALRAGASAFVSKAAPTEVVSHLVRRVIRGELAAPLWIAASGAEGAFQEPGEDLTPRQLEIVALLCQGHPNKEIGLRLGLAEVTVKMHVSSIFRTLGVANRTQAVLEARRRGLYPG